MKIYIDNECKCHTDNTGQPLPAFELPFFDGKCQTFVEGYRYCPYGESYTNESGEVFHGECFVPWKPYGQLAAAQSQYERDLAELQEAYREGVNSV